MRNGQCFSGFNLLHQKPCIKNGDKKIGKVNCVNHTINSRKNK